MQAAPFIAFSLIILLVLGIAALASTLRQGGFRRRNVHPTEHDRE